jgi:GNAT superfamily N-acetyltransferase
MRAYCDFYEVTPSDDALLEMARALIADPSRAGIQLLARAETGTPTGFATVFWTWSTLSASRVGILNDLYVVSDARGARLGEALIKSSVDRCREFGATHLQWQTARPNTSAQRLYERIGATREEWIDYFLEL